MRQAARRPEPPGRRRARRRAARAARLRRAVRAAPAADVWELLNTRCLSIAGGTTQILRNVAGERILGLPRWLSGGQTRVSTLHAAPPVERGRGARAARRRQRRPERAAVVQGAGKGSCQCREVPVARRDFALGGSGVRQSIPEVRRCFCGRLAGRAGGRRRAGVVDCPRMRTASEGALRKVVMTRAAGKAPPGGSIR